MTNPLEPPAAPSRGRPPRPFLTADWTNVVLANFRVDPSLLRPYLPPGSELDTPDGEPDLHLLSLVAFHFSHTRVFGLPLPGAQHFPEVNLRFYVRREAMRAVVFLREFVPPAHVVVGARWLYHQPYARAAITHQVTRDATDRFVRTTFAYREVRGTIELRARDEPLSPSPESRAHFLKEHYWGFDRDRRGRSFRYRVDHPVWRTYPVESATVTISPGALLGGDWRAIDWDRALHSVLYAEGSRAIVYQPEPLAAP